MIYIHILILLATLAVILQADSLGFAWVRGKVSTLDAALVARLHRYVWFGLAGMIITGATLFLGDVQELQAKPTFWAKMAFVATLIINSFVINRLMTVATKKPYASLSSRERLPLLLSGAVSTIAWLGAIAMAFTLE